MNAPMKTAKQLGNWPGSSRIYQISQWLSQKAAPKLVIVVADVKRAYFWQEQLQFLMKNNQNGQVFHPLDILPYYQLSPNPDIILKRLEFLYAQRKNQVLIVPQKALSRKTLPQDVFFKTQSAFYKGQELEIKQLSQSLVSAGYENTFFVEQPGQFAVRGGIIDIFSPAYDLPARIELFGDEIESLRFFDSEKQKSLQAVDNFVVISAREILFGHQPNYKNILKKRCDAHDFNKLERYKIIEAIENQRYFHGIESFIDFFYDFSAQSLLDYLDKDSVFFFEERESLLNQHDQFLSELEGYRQKSTSIEKIIAPSEIFLSASELNQKLENFETYEWQTSHPKSFDFHQTQINIDDQPIDPKIIHNPDQALKIKELGHQIQNWLSQKQQVILVCQTQTSLERLRDLLASELEDKILVESFAKGFDFNSYQKHYLFLVIGKLATSFGLSQQNQVWLSEKEIFSKQTTLKKQTKKREVFQDISELNPGDYVVHEEFGVGRYEGLTNLKLGNYQQDFLLLTYQGGDKLYVPVYKLNLIAHYRFSEGLKPALDKLGTTKWAKIRERVKKATRKLARELLKMQAYRQTRPGFAFEPYTLEIEKFEESFVFEETPDQLEAIRAVYDDMQKPKPMDRLICGDVGFGKTEVALRAAYKAVLNGKQVAILVPTTVLAIQHFETFDERFKNFGVNVALISRFQTQSQAKQIIEKLKQGKIDILVGTHRLLSRDVRFFDLGLLVIDEEHRFGVAQKEKIKKLKQSVDVLTLTATPIPRTLDSTYTQMRDLSLMETPPIDRMAIRTYTTEWNDGLIQKAIENEIKRDGQVFFVHNRVQSIEKTTTRLQKLLPKVRFRFAHGQMEAEELENIMLDFMHHQFDVLVCTTIIESGLDIPRANTMLINRADHMGLAQLYQLRGRVGRSNLRAYCYLIVPEKELMTRDAQKRLDVLKRFTSLGSGIKIASYDLEIRGAGNLLGAEQSGHIHSVGYDMYLKLLEEAIYWVRNQQEKLSFEPEILLPIDASIPQSLVGDDSLRLKLYRDLSRIQTMEECGEIQSVWQDQFGVLPSSMQHLIDLVRLKIKAKESGIVWLKANKDWVDLKFHAQFEDKLTSVVGRVSQDLENYRFLKDGGFGFRLKKQKNITDQICDELDSLF